MSDYTPTTEEVRNDYVCALSTTDIDDAEAGFDRWLAEVKAQAWEQGATTIVATMVMNGSNDLPPNPYRQGEEQ